MLRLSLSVAAAAFLAGCGGVEEDVAVSHDGGHAMSEMVPDAVQALAPLPDDGVAPAIDVSAAWMRPHPQGRDVTAAYFTVSLDAGAADRLVSARIDGADRVELHGHTMDPETGMMQMRPIGPQEIGTAGPLLFAPGGHHLMVFGLDPVVEGQSVSGVLMFERAGEIPVEFDVRSTAPAAALD
ncbi:copper chaperone PCu(A)C [Maricaulis salignorans]|uniref:copper chaperone PCu(A)C n=1 Tax=Maricaulis salignorans TaxID=144026 RepID=UPI003A925648